MLILLPYFFYFKFSVSSISYFLINSQVFFKIKWGDNIKNKYKDIAQIYNISDITDDCIKININRAIKNVYIYEVIPISILHSSDDMINDISNVYIQFLKEFNLEYQILISNRKFDAESYMKKYNNLLDEKLGSEYKHMKKLYIDDVYDKLSKEEIYSAKYYLIVAIRDQDSTRIEDVDKTVYKLNQIGCSVTRINGTENIKLILYECINKEKIIWGDEYE